MNRLVPFFLVLLSAMTTSIHAQVAVEVSQMNVLYIGLPNPIIVAVEGVNHEGLRLSCDRCTIVDSNGQYIVYVSKRGDMNIYIKHKNGDTLAVKNFRVRSIPKPQLRLGTLESGVHSKGAIRAQPGLYATLGGGFAYEGVRFGVDSAYVQIETIEGVIVCKQDGTRLSTPIRQATTKPFSTILVTEPYVSMNGGGEPLKLAPLIIQNRNFFTSFEYHPLIDRTEKYPDLGKCLFWSYDSVRYEMDGHSHSIVSKQVDENMPNNLSHFIDGDTFIHVQNANFRSFYDDNVLKEEGLIRNLDDSLSSSHVIGIFTQPNLGGISFTKPVYEVTTNIRLRTYPEGEWKYYHPNGKLFAVGRYVVEKAAHDNIGCYFDGNIPDFLYVSRTGTWKFYDESGQLILEKQYP